MKVLAIAAHPDDLEIFIGGTLAKYRAAGHSVTMAHLCNGDKGSFTLEPEVIGAIRHEEAQDAAAVIGAHHFNGQIPDGEVLASDREHREIVVDLIRQAQPDLILTHAPDDYMVDHNETSKLVFDASFLATEAARKTTNPNFELITPIYYFDAMAGLGFAPTEFVDITDQYDTKLAMYDKHVSQEPYLDEVGHSASMRQQIEIVAKFRGLQSGVKYAEAFRPCQAALRGTTKRLLP